MRCPVIVVAIIAAWILPGCTGCAPLPELAFSPAAKHPAAALMSAGGTGPTDLWLVGAQPAPNAAPLVLHGDGASWTPVDTGAVHDLWWVHAFAGGPVYLGGAGATLLRLDDGVPTRLPTPGFAGQTVFGVWGAAPDEVWAVGGFAGREGFAWRSDGVTVRDEPLPQELPRGPDGEIGALLKAWGRGADDVWLVGGVGTALHWDGAAFTVIPTGTTDTLFTVTGDATEVIMVGGGTVGLLLRGGTDALVDDTPPGAPLLQGVTKDAAGNLWVAGAGGYAAGKAPGGAWQMVELGFDEAPASVHALFSDGAGDLYAVGGSVLTPALDQGIAVASRVTTLFEPAPTPPPSTGCPADAVDPAPTGSMARRMREQLLNAIRRDIPNPPVHARNIFHTSAAIWDAWAAYDDSARGVFFTERVPTAGISDVEAERETAIAYAAYRVLRHRYAEAQGAAVTRNCLDDFMALLALDPEDARVEGDDAIAVGNRVGQAVIDAGRDDGANEEGGYVDTTGWAPANPPCVVDRPGTVLDDPNHWQQLNLALAETQNGIVLDTTVQPYLGAHWRGVTPFALARDPDTGWYSAPGDLPSLDDARLVDEVVEVIRVTAELDADDATTIDISPGARGNNPLGENTGTGHALNPSTGAPYAPNLVTRGDFARVVAEMWADGPKSETPPGHWLRLAHEVSDAIEATGAPLIPWGEGEAVNRLAWDAALGLAVSGSTHDAAIAAWEQKREGLGPRPISLIRHLAGKGQRSDASLPSYHPEGLPLVDGLIELITEESSAPGQRHFDLRFHVGELAVRSWPGEPGDRLHEHTPVQWMRALDWIPYQRRTFVTPAFPGFISGHSTFSRAAAEVLTAFTGSPYFPGGLGEFVAPAHEYLVFEDGPSSDVRLQWASYADAADQAGQSRLFGGIHVFSDDASGRRVGSAVGLAASALARDRWRGVE
ncbi:MAG: vanadium-dependent haloperoxidase [Deltaproteobacteria bacterium]|nr:vanadium-dependent haloperoxidase [Deltaproteobacteria bacterium]